MRTPSEKTLCEIKLKLWQCTEIRYRERKENKMKQIIMEAEQSGKEERKDRLAAYEKAVRECMKRNSRKEENKCR